MRVSYINGVCVNHDAISCAVRDEIVLLNQQRDVNARLFTYACDYSDLPCRTVQSPADIALDPHFQASDLVVFHFGVYYPLFDLIAAVPRQAKRLVVFHNITPKEMLPPSAWETIDRSFAQMACCVWADHVICDSDVNLSVLRSASIRVPATVLPLAVKTEATPVAKPSPQDGIVRLMFLGRFVRSKGPQDLLAALDQVMAGFHGGQIQLDLVGNLVFSDQLLLHELRSKAEELERRYNKQLRVFFRGSLPDADKRAALNDADIFVLPTYHEGFCIPIVEALASGCRVVAYENSNTPFISGGLAMLTPTGDISALAEALSSEIEHVSTPEWRRAGFEEFSKRARRHVSQFEPSRVGKRFLHFINDFMRCKEAWATSELSA